MVDVTIEDLTILAGAIADSDIIEMERPGAPSITRKITKINFVTDIDNADIAAGAGIATSKLADAANFVLVNQSNVYDANNQDFRSGNLRLANPTNTFHYAFTAAAIIADRMINLPLLAATDTLTVLALAQNFITGRKDFFDTILGLRNPANTFSYIFRSAAIIADRDVSFPLLTANDTIAMIGFANLWGDGIKQTFNPSGATPGINFGSNAGDPSTPADGDVWYNSTSNKFRGRENGANADLIGGGGAGLTFAKIVKSADEIVNNSTTFQDDDEITFTPTINKTYFWMMILLFISNTTADFKLQFTVPTGATMTAPNPAAIIFRTTTPTTFADDLTVTTTIAASNSNASLGFYGRLIMGSTAGDVTLQWAQATATVLDTKVLKGSILLVWEE